METNNHDIEIIELYIDGKLTDKEKEQFNERIEKENTFAELYQFRLKIRDDLQKAKQYEQIRNNVSLTISRTKKKARKRTIIYAVAASLTLLIAIPGVISITSGPDTLNQNMAVNDTVNNEIFTPYIKQPESFAKQGIADSSETSIEESLEIQPNLPEDGKGLFKLSLELTVDSIIFEWNQALKMEADLIISKSTDGKIVFKEKMRMNSKRYALQKKSVEEGNYFWKIGGFSAKDSFKIMNQ